jgi:predicted nuclease of restriction endonuclease-like RecB superfamily
MYIKWFVETKIMPNIKDIKNEIPNMFTINNFRNIGEHVLNHILEVKKHYSSYYEWLNKLYPEWNLTENDFKLHVACDGKTLCDSFEEKILFNHIYSDLGIKTIVGIGKSRKEGLVNLKENERYFPDFIIEGYDKKIYIEYYGLYTKNSSNHAILNSYRNKTNRKNCFYYSSNDYYFIDIYPSDLKNNFNGVDEKLTSFFMNKLGLKLAI